MNKDLLIRSATEFDLIDIIRLYSEDDLGATREQLSDTLIPQYRNAFQLINKDDHQALLVVESKGKIVGTCHLTFLPSLSFKGSMRLNIENVHVDQDYRNEGIGKWMMHKAIEMGKMRGCKFAQLTTNKKRTRAKLFYEKLGFAATHEGMKLYFGEDE